MYQHVRRIVEGADLMAWGEEHGSAAAGYRAPRVQNFTGLYHYNPNEAVARVMHRNFDLLGAADYTEDHHAFARDLQKAFGVEPLGMHTEVAPFDPDAAPEPGGSTDVANISWVCPTIDLRVAHWPRGIPAHSWASTAASGSPGAFLALGTASKVLACAGIDVLTRPEEVAAMRAEFETASASFPYVDSLGADAVPSLPSSMRD